MLQRATQLVSQSVGGKLQSKAVVFITYRAVVVLCGSSTYFHSASDRVEVILETERVDDEEAAAPSPAVVGLTTIRG